MKIEFGHVLMQSPASYRDNNLFTSSKTNLLATKDNTFKSTIIEIESRIGNNFNQKDKMTPNLDEDDRRQSEISVGNGADIQSHLLDELFIDDSKHSNDYILLENQQNALKGTDLNNSLISKGEKEQKNESILCEWINLQYELVQQFTTLLNNRDDVKHLTQTAKNTHKLLQLWGTLPDSAQQTLKDNASMLEDVTNESELMQQLISLFDKRNSLGKKQMYQMNSIVTQEDVQKWLEQALAKYPITSTQQPMNAQVESHSSIQMHHVQQYIMYASETERIDAISRSLVTDINNILNKGQFLRQPDLQSLTLTLRPQSLGDVTVRLVQINGEMMVKFLVTTQAAKELFESNLHQLKPMFAPNQIVIERDISIVEDEFYREKQEQPEDNEQQQEKEQQFQQDEASQHQLTFNELLQNISEEAT